MKNLILLALLLTLLIGCSDNPLDNGSNNPPPVSNDSLIFSIENIAALSFTSGGGQTINQHFRLNSNSFKNFKITFDTLSTNWLDTTKTMIEVFVGSETDTVNYFHFIRKGNAINLINYSQSFTVNFAVPNTLHVWLHGVIEQDPNQYFILVKNFKVYKIS